MNLELDLKSTLNLPDAEFTIPMKADLGTREPNILADWEGARIYHAILEARKDSPTFVLHDGPPYTNSPIHIGTAMNKILKDFVVKSRSLMGYRAPYVPGYDNHGLPIEQAVMKAFHEKGEKPDVDTLRKACREHARKYIDIQTQQFQRLGIFGLWERPYATMDFRYEAEIVRVFKRMVEGGYVYRGLRPVMWSPTSQTALADTEIVYQDGHVSTAIYVRFPLKEDFNGWSQGRENVYTIIWTTTPWTIPANLAVAFHPMLNYAVVRVGNDHYVLLRDLVERTMAAIGFDEYEIVEELLGLSLENSVFQHPIFDRDSAAVLADYVTTEDGTGVVHTAPGHGREDFMTGVKYGLRVLCPVDARGMMTEEAGEFAGLSYRDCDGRVVARLEELGNLLAVSDYTHSYPYAERDGKPVIFRATEQWFISMDTDRLRNRMLEEIERVSWIPDTAKGRITAMIANRPDWCISRQRPWGVGIPVFYGAESGKPVLDPVLIERVAELIEREGSDAWFTRPAGESLPEGYTHPETGETEFRKETDVFDVWFDSGATSLCVLEGNVEPQWKEPWPADLYLEGSDQHRGWFNTSLIIGTVTRGSAPYRQVLTHGFTLDEEGRKMSKRLMNALDPDTLCSEYGADVVRLWVAGVEYTSDVKLGENILKQVGEGYRRLRNTLRFLLANLDDYDGTRPTEVLVPDLWIVEQVDLLVADCMERYEAYDFGGVITAVHNFCVKQLSQFYLDAIKDRMYCDGRDWPSRRSAQWACHDVLLKVVKLLTPILVFTAEEVYQRVPGSGKKQSVHLEVLDSPDRDRLDSIEGNDRQARFAFLLDTRAAVFAQFETWKQTAEAKDSQDVVLVLRDRQDLVETLRGFGNDLANLMKFSAVEFETGEPDIAFRPSVFLKCKRCRLTRADVQMVGDIPLCERCRKAVGA